MALSIAWGDSVATVSDTDAQRGVTTDATHTHLLLLRFINTNVKIDLSLYCDQGSGRCHCKPNFSGDYCETCADGYYNFPFCLSKYPV